MRFTVRYLFLVTIIVAVVIAIQKYIQNSNSVVITLAFLGLVFSIEGHRKAHKGSLYVGVACIVAAAFFALAVEPKRHPEELPVFSNVHDNGRSTPESD